MKDQDTPFGTDKVHAGENDSCVDEGGFLEVNEPQKDSLVPIIYSSLLSGREES